MAALAGYDINIAYGTSGSEAEVEGLDSLTFSRGRDSIDVTSFPDTTSAANAFRKKIMGLKDTTTSMSGNYENSTVQNLIRTNYGSGTSASLVVTWVSGNTNTVTVFVESYEISAGVDGKVEFSTDMTANGDVAIV